MALPPPSQQPAEGLTLLLHPFPSPVGWDGDTARGSLVGQQQAGPLGPTCVPAGSWGALTAVKLKSHLLSAETTEYGVISVLT